MGMIFIKLCHNQNAIARLTPVGILEAARHAHHIRLHLSDMHIAHGHARILSSNHLEQRSSQHMRYG